MKYCIPNTGNNRKNKQDPVVLHERKATDGNRRHQYAPACTQRPAAPILQPAGNRLYNCESDRNDRHQKSCHRIRGDPLHGEDRHQHRKGSRNDRQVEINCTMPCGKNRDPFCKIVHGVRSRCTISTGISRNSFVWNVNCLGSSSLAEIFSTISARSFV